MDQIAKFIDAAMAEDQAAKAKPEQPPSEERVLEQCRWMVERGYLPHDPVAFRRLAYWLAGPRRRGLLLGGNVGTGKTEFVRLVTSAKIYKAAQWAANKDGIQTLLGGSFSTVIDELSDEPVTNHYGEKSEALCDVIHQCHESWRAFGVLTYITINLPHGEDGKPDWSIIRSRYGDRTADRIREMCFSVQFDGESLRGRGQGEENREKGENSSR